MIGFLPLGGAQLVAANISVGVHPQAKTFIGTLDLDTVWGTGAAVAIVAIMAFALRAKAKGSSDGVGGGVPSKFQLVWEMGLDAVRGQVQGNTDATARMTPLVPIAVSLFVFILVANWFSVLGLGATYEWLAPPTSDINLPLAMALVVIIPVHIASIAKRGPIAYVKHYITQPFPIFLFPVNVFMNVVDEVAKPITLALRLFGNLMSGGLMLALIAALAVWNISHVPIGDVSTVLFDPVWKLFDLLIGAIQAFIFALLAILYFQRATNVEAGH